MQHGMRMHHRNLDLSPQVTNYMLPAQSKQPLPRLRPAMWNACVCIRDSCTIHRGEGINPAQNFSESSIRDQTTVWLYRT
uniref:Uncharacterized protein n=1 Tax=Anguilla anguilla TaxID=7936 RepID=A0A0E9P705_ANGAN